MWRSSFSKQNENRKYHFNAHEENSRLRLIPPPVGEARALRTGTSWHGRVIVAGNEGGV